MPYQWRQSKVAAMNRAKAEADEEHRLAHGPWTSEEWQAWQPHGWILLPTSFKTSDFDFDIVSS
jgi:hypothetical protein